SGPSRPIRLDRCPDRCPVTRGSTWTRRWACGSGSGGSERVSRGRRGCGRVRRPFRVRRPVSREAAVLRRGSGIHVVSTTWLGHPRLSREAGGRQRRGWRWGGRGAGGGRLLGRLLGLVREAGAAGGAAGFPGGGEGHLVQIAIAHEADEDAAGPVIPGHARDHGYLHGGVRADGFGLSGLLVQLGLLILPGLLARRGGGSAGRGWGAGRGPGG